MCLLASHADFLSGFFLDKIMPSYLNKCRQLVFIDHPRNDVESFKNAYKAFLNDFLRYQRNVFGVRLPHGRKTL